MRLALPKGRLLPGVLSVLDTALFTTQVAKLPAALDDARRRGLKFIVCPYIAPRDRGGVQGIAGGQAIVPVEQAPGLIEYPPWGVFAQPPRPCLLALPRRARSPSSAIPISSPFTTSWSRTGSCT